jgi:hypothetical protein
MPNVKSHAERLAKITEWLGKNADEFYEAIGAWEGDEQTMVLLLSQIPKYLAGRYPMYKDAMAEQRDRTIASFLKGESVSNEELRSAIALLMQSLGEPSIDLRRGSAKISATSKIGLAGSDRFRDITGANASKPDVR